MTALLVEGAEGERVAIGKRLRFEILKRDGFRCRYCGRGAPEVVLHVDHIKPRALGGSDDPGNLIAACKGCNSGKSAVPLDVSQVAESPIDAVVDAALRDASNEVGWMLHQQRRFEKGYYPTESDLIEGYFPMGLPEGFM